MDLGNVHGGREVTFSRDGLERRRRKDCTMRGMVLNNRYFQRHVHSLISFPRWKIMECSGNYS